MLCVLHAAWVLCRCQFVLAQVTDRATFLTGQVFDCGPSVVKTVKECTYTREVDLNKKFPDCCPTFTCTDGFDARDLLRPAGAPPAPESAEPAQ